MYKIFTLKDICANSLKKVNLNPTTDWSFMADSCLNTGKYIFLECKKETLSEKKPQRTLSTKNQQNHRLLPFFKKTGCLVGWLVVFYGISTFVGYLTPNLFYKNCSISNNSV